jgi:hypothetical protein
MRKGDFIDSALILLFSYFFDFICAAIDLEIVIGGVVDGVLGGAAEDGAEMAISGQTLHLDLRKDKRRSSCGRRRECRVLLIEITF